MVGAQQAAQQLVAVGQAAEDLGRREGLVDEHADVGRAQLAQQVRARVRVRVRDRVRVSSPRMLKPKNRFQIDVPLDLYGTLN